ncbi:MAG TPA: FAD-dependent oxidoreductase [Thermoleophilaceae bacterium]
MTSNGTSQPLHVVVAGAGVAGLETVMALRDLAGKRVRITLLDPSTSFVYRPLTVGEPFALGPARATSLAQFARDFDCELVHDTVAEVMPDMHTLTLQSGDEVTYDKLVVTLGARREPAFQYATTFRGQEDVEALHGLVQDVEGGYVRSIVFVVPSGVSWSLPLYELALMTARRAYEMCMDVDLTFVTPEERVLPLFGSRASADVRAMLEQAGIDVRCGFVPEIPAKGTVLLHPSGDWVEADRVVALPVVRGRRVTGLPCDSDGFLPIDSLGRVAGVADVYAAGDGANFPVKQGGIACQQADVAASHIARAVGVPIDVQPFRAVLRGQLLTGTKPHFMRHDLHAQGADSDESTGHMLWWPPTKVAGRYLASYIAVEEERERAAAAGPGARRRAVVAPVPSLEHETPLRGYEFVAR